MGLFSEIRRNRFSKKGSPLWRILYASLGAITPARSKRNFVQHSRHARWGRTRILNGSVGRLSPVWKIAVLSETGVVLIYTLPNVVTDGGLVCGGESVMITGVFFLSSVECQRP